MIQEETFSAIGETAETADNSTGGEECTDHNDLQELPEQALPANKNFGLIDVKCSKRFRKGVYLLAVILLMIIIPTVIWYSIKAGETKAKPQVEKVVSGKVTCSKSNGGIECACDDGLFWNGTHCNAKVNGSWCEWLPDSPCSVSCGYGHQKLIRYCECPSPENGGSYCIGQSHLSLACNIQNCTTKKGPEIINGSWCEWHQASHCNVTCGEGYQKLIRYCSCPSPRNGGSYCSGASKSVVPCIASNCSTVTIPYKVNGSWCDWLLASPCNASCGYGHQELIRYCECPAPENGGSFCSGRSKTTRSCSQGSCINETESEMCNFEYGLGKETCHWTQDKSDDFDWTVNLQPPQVSSTGPHTDHTLRPKNTGHFLYIQSNRQKYLDKARLLSRLQSPTPGSCFTLWYNMNGIGIGQLNIYKVAGNRFHLLLNKSGDHKDRWNYVAIHFNSTQPYQLAIEGVVGKHSHGSTSFGNIAIDDLMISRGICRPQDPIQCNHTYTVTDRHYTYLSSPFFPEYYANKLDCYYHLETRPGYVFKLTFNRLMLENSSYCSKDSLKVFEHNALQKMYCGKHYGYPTLISTGNRLLLVLKTDESAYDAGFFASVAAIKKPCKFTFKTTSGNFTFPLYPERKQCEYSIMASNGKMIKVDFPVFTLQQSRYCNSERVDIYEKSINFDNRKRRYCGDGPKTYTSQSNVIHIVYISSVVPSKQNFFGQYSLIDKPCSYNVTSSSNQFSSPNFPLYYPNNIYCKYYFKVPNDRIIKISMTNFILEQSPSCAKDSVAVYEGNRILQGKIGNMILQGKICGSVSSSLSWTSKDNKVLMVFQADVSNSNSGFKGYFSEMKKPCNHVFTTDTGSFTSPQDPDYWQGGGCIYEINVGNAMSIKIDFPVFSLPVNDGCFSSVYINVYENVMDYQTVKLSLSGNGTRTFQSYSNKVYLKFFTASFCPRTQGFHANYSATSKVCRYFIDAPPYKFSTPGYPSNYPNNSHCEYHIKVPKDKAVKIHFGFFSLQSSDGCRNDSLKIYERGALKATFCGRKSSTVWSSVESDVLLVFQSDSTTSSSGIYGYCQVVEKPCDHSFDGATGNFSSPGFPGAHPRNKPCTYHITAAHGKSIRIFFKSYSLRQSSACDQEYIAIYENSISKDTLRSQFCGNGSRTYYSFSNKVHIVFNPVYYNTLPLFHANYSEVDRDCVFILTPPFDRIASPGYPDSYPNNITCRYYFRFLSGKKLMIRFSDFKLQSSPLCQNDSVKFYESGVLQGTYCGFGVRVYTAVRHEVVMIFQADALSSFKGFYGQLYLKEKASPTCNDRYKYTAPSGYFASPNFPAKYPRRMECRYHIEVEKGKSIKIEFTVMELACLDESVAIYEDGTSGHNMKSKLCGVGSKSFRSVSNNVYVIFTPTEYYQPKHGFSAYYTTVDRQCRYILTPPSFRFTSPNFSPNGTYCQYFFRVPDSKAIKINFDYMGLQPSASCSMESIKIYEDGELKVTYCRRGYYYKWTSTGSNALMVFQSNGSSTSYFFKGSFQLVEKACDYTFTSPSGFFKSPEIPCKFARGTECKYHITVANGKGIKIEFPFFQLLDSSSCTDEYVAVYEETIQYETRKAIFCGNRSRIFHSYSNKVHLVFHSSLRHKSYQGFHANYTEIDRVCNYTLTPPSYIFSSPGYPNDCPNITYCEYRINVQKGRNVVMFFKKLSLQPTPSCTEASIKLYEKSTLNETFCGEKPFTRTWLSSGNEVLMIFRTNTSSYTKGFHGSYSWSSKPCFHSYTSESGNFSSVGYPNKYEDDLKCHYNIKVKQGNSIRLNFDPFDLEYSLTCRYDYLKIYNIFPSNIHLAATFCGTGVRTFQSNSSEVLVEFRSDETFTASGFFVKYTSFHAN